MRDFRITVDINAPAAQVWSAGANARANHTVDPWENGSRVTLSVCYGRPLGAMVGWLLRDLTQRYLGLEAAGLKRRCEGG